VLLVLLLLLLLARLGVVRVFGKGWALTVFLFRFLDAKDSTSLEYKLDSFSSVYRKLTGKDVVFEFPVQVAQD
jgi:hypothetical protein